MNNNELNNSTKDSLSSSTPIKRISNINRNLWEEVEKYRNKQEEDAIDFSYEDGENVIDFSYEKEKPVQKKLGTKAFTSISIMAITTTLVSIGILVLGLMILN